MPSIYIEPDFGSNPDPGDGGIRRVVSAQRRHLPDYGYSIALDLQSADLILSHGGNLPKVPPSVPWIAQCHGAYWREYQWEQWCYQLNAQVAESLRLANSHIAP